jgi:hypothetical protein
MMCVQVFWYIPLPMIVRLFYGDPDFNAVRGSDRDYTNGSSYYGSKEGKRANAATGGQMFMPQNSIYEIGGDAASVFNFRAGGYKSSLIFVRYSVGLCTTLQPTHSRIVARWCIRAWFEMLSSVGL